MSIVAHGPVGDTGLALVTILGITAVYASGVTRQRGAGRGGRPARRRLDVRLTAFAVAVLALVLALASPLEAGAQERFSLHMVQHLLLTVVAAPALALAGAPATLAAGMPAAVRRRVHRSSPAALWRRTGRQRAAAVVLAAAAGHVVVVTAWHIPTLYDLAVSDELVHAAEHATLLGSGLLFWTLAWRMRAPVATFVATSAASFASGLLGALITFAPSPIYDAYRTNPLEDQQLAGVIMWVPGGLAYLALAVVIIVRSVSFDVRHRRTDTIAAVERATIMGSR